PMQQPRENAVRSSLRRNSLRSAIAVAASPVTTTPTYVEMEDPHTSPTASSREATRPAGGSLPWAWTSAPAQRRRRPPGTSSSRAAERTSHKRQSRERKRGCRADFFFPPPKQPFPRSAGARRKERPPENCAPPRRSLFAAGKTAIECWLHAARH